MYKDYNRLKNEIMSDKMLSAEGKRLKIKELQDKARESLNTDKSLNKLSSESVSNKIQDLKKQKFNKKLPIVDVPGLSDLYGGEKVLASLLGQQVALLAEQRMSERLIARLSMESNHRNFASIIDDCLYEQFGASAIMRAMPHITALTEKFEAIDKAHLRLSDLYARAIDAEKDNKEKAWEVAHGEELKQLESRNHELAVEGMMLGVSDNNLATEDVSGKQEQYFNAGTPSSEGQGYFEGR